MIEASSLRCLMLAMFPTAAALVPKASEWPGVVSLPTDFLRGPVEVERPAVFFRELGPTPKRVKLELVPPGIEEETVEEFVEMLADELELREADISLQHAAAGRPIMGRKAVLEQDPFAYPEGITLDGDRGIGDRDRGSGDSRKSRVGSPLADRSR